MTRWLPAAVVLSACLCVVACGAIAASQTPTTSPSPTPTTSPPPTPTAEATRSWSNPPEPQYTAYPDPPGTYTDCRPYAGGAEPTPTPKPGATPGPTFDLGALVPCGRDEWRQALEPALRAVSRDKKSFCSGYFSVSMFDPGPWRFEINIVDGANPDARSRVEKLIQAGAPVEWRTVKYSWDDLVRVQKSRDLLLSSPLLEGRAVSVGIDVEKDAISITTLGPQPELEAALQQEFGDMVTVVTGSGTPLTTL